MGFTAFIKDNARWLAAGGLISLSSSFGQTFFISVFAGEIMEDFSLTAGQWGAIYSAGTLASAAIMTWAGGLSDHFRAKTLGSAMLLMLAAAAVFMALVQNQWLLVLAIFALRFSGQGMLSHISIVAIGRWFSANRGKALAVSALGYAVGEALLPLLFVSLLAIYDWRMLWLVAAVILVLAVPVLQLLLRRERRPHSIAQTTQHMGMGNRHWTRKQALSHPLFWLLLPLVTAPAIFVTALFFQQVHLTTSKGWDHSAFVAMFPLFSLVAVVSSLAFGSAIDRFGSGRLMPLYQLPLVVAYLLFAFGDSLWSAAFGFVFLGLLLGGASTVAGAFWPEYYGTQNLGKIKALVGALMVLGSAIGPAITGLLIDQGVPFADQMVYFAAYILAASALGAFGLRKYSHPKSATAAV